jgi:hypothetical protein
MSFCVWRGMCDAPWTLQITCMCTGRCRQGEGGGMGAQGSWGHRCWAMAVYVNTMGHSCQPLGHYHRSVVSPALSATVVLPVDYARTLMQLLVILAPHHPHTWLPVSAISYSPPLPPLHPFSTAVLQGCQGVDTPLHPPYTTLLTDGLCLSLCSSAFLQRGLEMAAPRHHVHIHRTMR